MASAEQAGVMPAESFSQIGENTTRIAALEGRSVHYPVTLASASPSPADLQAAYEAASGKTGEAPDQSTLDDTAFGKTYTWYESSESWVDRGSTQVSQFTNTSAGVIKGANADGKLFAEEDGTGSVVGWDNLKTRTANLETGKVNTSDVSATPEANKIPKYDESGRLKSGAEPEADNDVVRKADLEAVWAAKLSLEYPVGSLSVQYPSGSTPAQKSLPGTWEPWSYRASLYAVGNTAPSEAFKNDWKTYRHDIWSLNTDGTVATQGTKKYSQPAGYTCVERQALQPDWTAADLVEGAQVTIEGETKYIWQVIAFAGLFFGGEDSEYLGGGKRPTFITGGRQDDRIREITGKVNIKGAKEGSTSSGALVVYNENNGNGAGWLGSQSPTISLEPSRVVPVGLDNAPTNISTRFWRRVA
jgi:hypothetical protein